MPLGTLEIHARNLLLTCRTFLPGHCSAPLPSISLDFYGSQRNIKPNIYALIWTTDQRKQCNKISIMNLDLVPFGSNKQEQLNNFSLEMCVCCPFTEDFNAYSYYSYNYLWNIFWKTHRKRNLWCSKGSPLIFQPLGQLPLKTIKKH